MTMSESGLEVSNREIWQAVIKAWAEGDVTTLERLVDPDLTIVEPDCLPYKGIFKGPEGYAELYRQIVAVWDEMEVEKGELVGGENGQPLVIEYLTTATSRLTGKRMVREPSLAIWKFRDGKVVSMTPYNFDTARICALLVPD
jgi:ketosteroid isomerase-like protein